MSFSPCRHAVDKLPRLSRGLLQRDSTQNIPFIGCLIQIDAATAKFANFHVHPEPQICTSDRVSSSADYLASEKTGRHIQNG